MAALARSKFHTRHKEPFEHVQEPCFVGEGQVAEFAGVAEQILPVLRTARREKLRQRGGHLLPAGAHARLRRLAPGKDPGDGELEVVLVRPDERPGQRGQDPVRQPRDPDAGPLDPRIDHSIGRRGLPYLDHGPHPGVAWIRDQNYGGPLAPKKFIWSKAEEATGVDKSSWTPGYSAINVPIIRFADVLLMAAEAEVELNQAGGLERARGYVNSVRQRAANAAGFVTVDGAPAANYSIAQYPGPWTDQTMARNAVRFERKLELSGEGHRFFDLVRWGIAEPTLNAYLNYERSQVSASPFVGATFNAGKDEYMPIPQREIDILGADVLQQNPGY